MAVSDLRRRKLTAVFDAVDNNDNGFWEFGDMQRIADGFAARNDWSEDSYEFQSLSKLLGDWWEWLRTGATSTPTARCRSTSSSQRSRSSSWRTICVDCS